MFGLVLTNREELENKTPAQSEPSNYYFKLDECLQYSIERCDLGGDRDIENMISWIFDNRNRYTGRDSTLLKLVKRDSKCFERHCELKYKRRIYDDYYGIENGDTMYLATVYQDTDMENRGKEFEEGVFTEIQIVW